MSRHSRRTFLAATASSAALAALPKTGLAQDAASRVRLGFIGLGGRGGQLLDLFRRVPGVRVTALCDADTEHLKRGVADHPRALATQDLREVIDSADVDAVVIATPNHWHCLAGVWALEAGKHVYVEKPLGHNVREGRQLVDASKQHSDKIVQIGTQQRSDPLQAEVKAYLHEDQKLGKPQYVLATRFGIREPIGKRAEPLRPPQTLDYNLWLGPAADETIYRDRLHYDWHWTFNLGSGEMGNWGPHILDDVRNVALRDAAPLPSRVFAAGGRAVWDDAGTTPNLMAAAFETPSMPVFLGLSNLPARPGSRRSPRIDGVDTGYVVHCEGGHYAGWRGGGKAYDKQGNLLKEFKGDGGHGHYANFIDAVRQGDAGVLNGGLEQGHYSTAWCHLANIGCRVGGAAEPDKIEAAGEGHPGWQHLLETLGDHLDAYGMQPTDQAFSMSPTLNIDVEAERFTGDGAADANPLLSRKYRKNFEMPAIG